jgi:transposase-like protein
VKKSRFNEAQIIGVLREQEAGSPTAEVCRWHGISEQTFYRWKAKYSGMTVSDAHACALLRHGVPGLEAGSITPRRSDPPSRAACHLDKELWAAR